MVWLPQLPKKQRACGHLHYATDVSRHQNRLHSRLCPARAVWAHMQTTLLCGLSHRGGPDQLSRSSLGEISNVVSRMTFRDIWSSSHSISRQKSLEQGSASLATLSLSDLLALTHWSIDKIMPHMNFQTVFDDRCNFKGLTVPSSVVFKGTHFFLRLHLHLYFLKLNKWDLLFLEKRRNVTLYFITPFKGNQVPPVCRNQLQHRPAQANVCVLLFQRVMWC